MQVFNIEEFIIKNFKKIFIREKIKSGEVVKILQENPEIEKNIQFFRSVNFCNEEKKRRQKEVGSLMNIHDTKLINGIVSRSNNSDTELKDLKNAEKKLMKGGVQLDKVNDKTIVDYDLDWDIINDDCENFIEISDWEKDLLNYYLGSIDFSGARLATSDRRAGKHIFKLTFKMFILWKILSTQSKKHKNRQKEVIQQAREYNGEYDLTKAVGIIRDKKMKQNSAHCNFFLLKNSNFLLRFKGSYES